MSGGFHSPEFGVMALLAQDRFRLACLDDAAGDITSIDIPPNAGKAMLYSYFLGYRCDFPFRAAFKQRLMFGAAKDPFLADKGVNTRQVC